MTILTRLEEGNIDGLVWVEISRMTPAQFYGKPCPEDLPDHLREDIPDGIGEQYFYSLSEGERGILFARRFNNASPLSASRILNLFIREDTRLFLRLYDFIPQPMVEVTTDSMHLLRQTSDFPETYIFTEDGNRIIGSLVSAKDTILGVPGLREDAKKELEYFLNVLAERYASRELFLRTPSCSG